MHPILQSWRRFAGWMAAWIPLGAALGIVAGVSGHLSAAETVAIVAPVTLMLALICLSPYYVCRSAPLRSSSPYKILANQLSAALVSAGLVMVAGEVIAYSFSSSFPELRQWFRDAAPVMVVMLAMIYLLSVALHYAFLELESSRRAEVLASEAQIRALKAQVNPHFLFNSLNSISALTTVDAAEAREMCIRLADFLRTSLRLGERVTVPFAEEMALTRMYLDVEQVRFGGKLKLRQDLDPACSDCEVPALLIQPLVENAVKHGIAMMAEGGEIAMAGHRVHDWLYFTISNPFDPEAPSGGRNGLGLRNVRERLEARYGGGARMEITAGERTYRVALTLPAKVAK